jgi:hypothetical protein
MDEQFLGTGMKFPPQINPTTGRFRTVSGKESIRESIYLILMTQRGERFMNPTYGSNLMSYTFASTDTTMQTIMASELTSDILRCEPRVSDVQITMDPDSKPGCMFINIDYTVAASNSVENMVFPFYLNGQPEKESEAYETMDNDMDEQV